MSDQTLYMAYVDEWAMYVSQRRANDAVLADLPVDDPTGPPLCRAMVSVTGESAKQGSYDGRVIMFAGHINGAGMGVAAWLDKFEAVLRRLYWYKASVFVLHSWDTPDLQISYKADHDLVAKCHTPNALPCDRWTFNAHQIVKVPCDNVTYYVGPKRIVTPGERQ